MKLMSTVLSIVNLINIGFKYVVDTSQLYKIDESHALKHSMEVYRFAKNIYDNEVKTNKFLETQQNRPYETVMVGWPKAFTDRLCGSCSGPGRLLGH